MDETLPSRPNRPEDADRPSRRESSEETPEHLAETRRIFRKIEQPADSPPPQAASEPELPPASPSPEPAIDEAPAEEKAQPSQPFQEKAGESAAPAEAVFVDHTPASAGEGGDLPPADEAQPVASGRRRRPWLWRSLAAVGILLVVGLIAGYFGYRTAVKQRLEQAQMSRAVEAVTQFELGILDMEAERFEIAAQRFQYVIQVNPEYPGAADYLAQAMLAANTVATPTLAPTPTLTPTPDTRDVEERFAHAESLVAAEDWTTLLDTLDTLRKNDPEFNPVQVDGMYYLALRNRGVYRILNEGDLEGGIFDLTRAEHFGRLDAEANSYRQWASWYITGASFWEVDWSQAVYYLNLVVTAAPNLWDGAYTVQDRLATAQAGYADELIEQALQAVAFKDYCEADDLFNEARNYKELDDDDEEEADYAFDQCVGEQEEDEDE